MLPRLLRVDALLRAVAQQAVEQVEAVWREGARNRAQRRVPGAFAWPRRKVRAEVAEPCHPGPRGLRRRPEALEDLVELADLVPARVREERPAGRHLKEDAADGPHVDWRGVVLGAEQHLRGPVPEADDLVRQRPVGQADCATEAEVRDYEGEVARGLVLVYEQVLRLEVAIPMEWQKATPLSSWRVKDCAAGGAQGRVNGW